MGLDAGDDDLVAGGGGEKLGEPGLGEAGEMGFLDHLRRHFGSGQQGGYLGQGRAQPFGVLLRSQHRHFQGAGGGKQYLDVGEDALEAVHRRGEPLLQIDDQQRRTLDRKQHRRPSSLAADVETIDPSRAVPQPRRTAAARAAPLPPREG